MESREAQHSKGDQSLHLPLSDGEECQECGLFQETSMRLTPLWQISNHNLDEHKMADEESQLPEPACE